ncbi:dUTP diphosphatase [bacterium]|nr:dUTP diphosphatase [bacterium]
MPKKVKIKLIDKSLPVPAYQTKGSVAFDIYARKTTVIKPKEIKLVPSNIILEVPKGYFLLIAARSSLPLKKGLMLPNGIGVIDQDFCGPKDEIHIELYNFSNKKVVISKGERIAQTILVKIAKPNLVQGKIKNRQSRGGFGSTGSAER